MTTPKQTVHDWSSGSLVEYETDTEPAPETIPREPSTDETPTADA
jgi:hypothetical protein